MAGSGSIVGTVVRWDDAGDGAVIEAPDLDGECWGPAAVVDHSTTGARRLRAGQVVELEWAEPGAEGLPYRALRVTPRDDLQASIGG